MNKIICLFSFLFITESGEGPVERYAELFSVLNRKQIWTSEWLFMIRGLPLGACGCLV